ncbi:MAG: HAD-IA family hydrolase [Clostridia bacterium]|nr:HAD-IA family hydrolase [Clostridia bacterium]
MIKAVFIDIDNTLLDFDAYAAESMREGFEKFGLPPYEPAMLPVFKSLNEEFWRMIERGELDLEGLRRDRWNIIFRALGISFDGETFEAFFRERLFSSAIPVEGAHAMLSYLAPKYILCAASNGPYEQQMNRLRLAKMDGYFKFFFISGEMGLSKPSRAFFDAAIGRINAAERDAGGPEIRSDEMMIIGDSLSSDIAGGRACGLKTCLFDPRRTLMPGAPAPDYVIHELHEVRGIL